MHEKEESVFPNNSQSIEMTSKHSHQHYTSEDVHSLNHLFDPLNCIQFHEITSCTPKSSETHEQYNEHSLDETNQPNNSNFEKYIKNDKTSKKLIKLNKHRNSSEVNFSKTMSNSVNFKESEWTREEDSLLEEKFFTFGGQWNSIQIFFPGKSVNDIKNRWNKISNRYNIENLNKSKRNPIESDNDISLSKKKDCEYSNDEESEVSYVPEEVCRSQIPHCFGLTDLFVIGKEQQFKIEDILSNSQNNS
ncbi:hypothetical protein TRFO_10400 [Tritrichomonas foetus]|uniref:Uncharacterized protein n=1 Tax=Tritrichomonas foetus TaxID=1144522 RepID=A0A1J4JE75_9EUKA|nr:hypothetical protein TRFO_10400 [Tritrichomonas foetus]|eukprot:OHS95741.1 hypothetical protein TRFO_10400 [Tritrichomonas foetus]